MAPRARRRTLLACLALIPIGALAQQIAPEVASHLVSGPQAGTILGRDVFDSKGENVGQLVDVVVDRDGKPIAGVIDVGGFLGVGTRRVAIAWRLLRFVHDNDGTHVVMDLTFDSAAAAPEFEGPDNALIVIDRPPP
jgi:sporulation protein YlmC with PRC-barrel domain